MAELKDAANIDSPTQMEAVAAQLDAIRQELRGLRPQTRSALLSDIIAKWLPRKLKGMASAKTFEGRVKNYVIPILGAHDAGTLKPKHIANMLQALLEKGLSPETANHVRDAARQAIDDAIANDEWPGKNPVDQVDKLTVPEHEVDTLTREEAYTVLTYSPKEWRALFAVAIYLGPRRGEIFAVRKTDVELDAGFISFKGSHQRLTTKDGKKRTGIPIPDELRPYIVEAMAASPGEFLFMTPDGKQWSRNTKLLGKILQATLAAEGINKKMTFHDLRHTSSTLHQEAGCQVWVVSKVLGHSQRSLAILGNMGENTTARRYTHFSVDFVRRELNKLSLNSFEEPPVGPTSGETNLRPSSSAGQSIGLLSRGQKVEAETGRRPLPASANFSGRRFASLDLRFWSKVRKTPACWLWLGATQPDGYGIIKRNTKKLLAHRVSWELERGPLLPGFVICHKCDNPSCVRPAHLMAGTQWSNQQDKVKKKRQARGERNGRAKLTSEAVLEIRRLFAAGGRKADLARTFGVSKKAIAQIVNGETWKLLMEVLS